MVKVLIKKLSPDVELPSYKTSGSSGMDLMAFIKSPIVIKPKTSDLIPIGISMAFSEEYEIQIRPRSGLAAKNNISVLCSLHQTNFAKTFADRIIVMKEGNILFDKPAKKILKFDLNKLYK